MKEPIFWDFVGPIALLTFIIIFTWSLYGLKRKSFYILLTSVILSSVISVIFWWSVGKFLIFVSILQLIMAIYILVNNRNQKALP